MIYQIRVILDTEEDVFRDIEIEAENSLEDLHNAIVHAFGFEGGEMASFYISDEAWALGEEISLFDMSEGTESIRVMEETSIDSILGEDQHRLIYIYDFLSMWAFYVELAGIIPRHPENAYPMLIYAVGALPEFPPEREFKAQKDVMNLNMEEEDLNPDDYENLDFDENWN